MKIYTKKGDTGETSLIGGTRVPKHHLRIEAYGTVDELNSWIGLLRDQKIDDHSVRMLVEIQEQLFTIGSLLAEDPGKSRMKLPQLTAAQVVTLENEIDLMDKDLPGLTTFILPGGHTVVSFAHIARCVCRRAERLVVHLNVEQPTDPLIITYLNRLSDYLFTLARFFARYFNAAETPWIPAS
jgi:cob(I)alamin adenosyltransferase